MTFHHARIWLLVSCAAIGLLFASHASAQNQTSILVVRAPRVPSSLQRDVQHLLAPLGEIVSDTDYVKAARRMRLSPHDSRAIVALLPGLGIGLVVTVETTTRNAGRYLRLSYRNPETGDEVVKDELPYRSGPLPSSYSNWIVSQARLALSTLGVRAPQTQPARPGAAAQAWRNRARATPVRPQATPEFGDDGGNPPEFGDDGSGQPDATPAATPDDGSFAEGETEGAEEELAPRVLQVDGVVGLGLGQRAVTLPHQAGTRLLDVGPFATVDGAVRTRLRLSETFQLTLALRYYSSIGLTGESTPAAGVAQAVPLRSQRLEAVFGPSFRLSEGETVPWFAIYVGYAAQDLRGLVEITIPRYSLGGPLARLDLRAIIANGRITLWAMPEAQWVALVDSTLQRLHVAKGGLAVGGELGFSIRLNDQFLFEASYRESHSFVATPEQTGFQDLERVFTTRLVVQR